MAANNAKPAVPAAGLATETEQIGDYTMSYVHSSLKNQLAFYQRAAEEAKEIANPDSPYWFSLSKTAQAELEAMIGADEYETWAEAVWPGDSIDNLTWEQIYRQTNRALDDACQGERNINSLAHVAIYEWQSTPKCYGL